MHMKNNFSSYHQPTNKGEKRKQYDDRYKYTTYLVYNPLNGGLTSLRRLNHLHDLANTVVPPTLVASIVKAPFWLIVPANTRSPAFFSTGIGSPLSILSSTEELPCKSVPSTGIFSPGRTLTTLPTEDSK